METQCVEEALHDVHWHKNGEGEWNPQEVTDPNL